MIRRFFERLIGMVGMGILVACLTQCTQKIDGSSEQLTETVDSFAYHYFNYHLKQASRFCTEDSQKWLEFLASNIVQGDVDLLREQENEAEISHDEILLQDTDSIKIIRMTVRNHLMKDSIGKVGRIVRKSVYDIQAVKHRGKWFIRMEGPLQSEKQNHD